jgi:Rps23 Pro-64 3,4-dihydroxylase Tpa1-like proline 4-hydroxylase
VQADSRLTRFPSENRDARVKIIATQGPALVIDDFLEHRAFQLVGRYVQDERYEFVHRHEWIKAWRLHDGIPLRGPVTLSHSNSSDRVNRIFPVGLGIDLLISRLLEIEDDLVPWTGRHGADWSYFFCRPYIYPVGTALSWHKDNQHNTTAAFTYYCHPTWNVAWGGELLLAEGANDVEFSKVELYGGEQRFIGTHFDNSAENDALFAEGIGQFILPKPNRLVVIPVGFLHCIKRVDEAAGLAIRMTLQGTFMDPSRDASTSIVTSS